MNHRDTEIELKFLVSHHRPYKQVRKKFADDLSVFGFVVAEQKTQKLTDIYFDTTACDLERASWTLRCRHNNSNNVTISLKSITSANATFRRTEHEEVLPVSAISVDQCLDIPQNSKTIQLLHKINLPTQNLLPLFEQANKRTTYSVTHPTQRDTEVQWCVDRVKLKGRSRLQAFERYQEFELELVSGDEHLLQHLNLIAQRCAGLSASRMSKFMRARYAHAPKSSSIESSTPTRSTSNDPYKFKTRLKHLIRHEPFAYEALHHEGVHQLRISTRKLRASLSLLHQHVPATVATQLELDLRKLTRRLGKVRDLDVHREQLGPLLQRDGWQKYLEHLNANTLEQQLRMRKVLATSFWDIVNELDMLTVTDFTDACAKHISADATEIMDRVKTTTQGIDANSDAKRLHRLRIELKKLRYQLTTYAADDEQAAQFLLRMKTLLALLGGIQDTEMAQQKIKTYLHGKPKSEKREFKSFLRLQKRLAAEYRAALTSACSEL